VTGSRQIAAGLLGGLVAGLVGGLFGVGGGIILIPILTGLFALTQHQAHGTSLGVVTLTAIGSMVLYATHAQVDWVAAALIAPASALTAGLGARWAARTSPTGLKTAFGAFLVIVGIRLILQPHSDHALLPISSFPASLAFDLAVGAVTGVLAGYMGVGGGVIVVPALVLLRGMDQHIAQGTSLAVIMVTAPFAVREHSRHGNVAWPLIPALGAGALLGGPLGATAASKLSNPTLARSFGIFLLVNAVLTLRAAQRARRTAVKPMRPAAPAA